MKKVSAVLKSTQMLRQKKVRVPKVDRGVRSILGRGIISVSLSHFAESYPMFPSTVYGRKVAVLRLFLFIGLGVGLFRVLCLFLCFSKTIAERKYKDEKNDFYRRGYRHYHAL